MRILLLTDRFPVHPDVSASVWMHQHVRSLRSFAGVEVVNFVRTMPRLKALLVRDHSGRRFQRQRAPQPTANVHGARVHHLSSFSIPDSLSWNVNPWLLYLRHRKRLRSLMESGQYDLILVHFVHPSALAGLRLGREFNVPVAIAENETLEVYEQEGKQRGIAWMLSRLREAQLVITQCEMHRASLARRLHGSRIVVLPLACDAHEDSVPPTPDPPLRCVFVGRLDDINKHATAAVDGVARAREQSGMDVILTIVGDGLLRKKLEQYAVDRGVRECITFTGWIPAEDIPAFLRQQHIFLFPSAAESFGVVFLEAAEAGLPMIVNEHAGVVHELRQYSKGILVMSESTGASIHEALRTMHEQYGDFHEAARKGRDAILSEFSWERHGERYRKALEGIVRKTPR